MLNVEKNVTNEYIMGSKVKFNIFLMLFTNEKKKFNDKCWKKRYK